MLQHPLPLPSSYDLSSKRSQASRRGSNDPRSGKSSSSTSRHAPAAATVASSTSSSHPLPTQPHLIPLSILSATFPSSSFSPSPSQPSSPLPTPSAYASKHFPRSPLSSNSPSPLPRSPRPILPSTLPSYESARAYSHRSSGSISSELADVLCPGDLLGEDIPLQGELITRVVPREPASDTHDAAAEPAKEFEVVRRLGTGSYAVVYLVREVLVRPTPSDDGHCSAVGRMDLEGDSARDRWEWQYGREYAVKLLSKANLDEEALANQLFEATIHQSLPPHPNVVTLHRTLETPSYLLLLLEFVPGEDLFYFLEQARDHYDSDPSVAPDFSTSPTSDSCLSTSSCTRTPPTPSLLSSLNPSQLLSKTRLRLIASMFAQMCEAVAVCHENTVFHRDIKPENFIVTDGWTEVDGRRQRKVIVKLTDFGLSTNEEMSADMDCGSAPYMSFECRNNLHPTYSPRAADVWSLGIVLINMLYHYNPWSDTTEGVCSSFELFRQQPINFFMQRFAGMTLPVAEFLATKVFCILERPDDVTSRVSARAFGQWAKDLPTLFAPTPSSSVTGSAFVPGHSRNVSVSSVVAHSLASVPHSRRPSLRHAPSSDASITKQQRGSWNLSRAPSLGPAYETSMELELAPVLSTVQDQELDEADRDDEHEEPGSRSASTHKRRKRGARKGKNLQLNMSIVGAGASVASSIQTQGGADGLDHLADHAQQLAREISRTSKTSGIATLESPAITLPPLPSAPTIAAPTPLPAASTISKKQSKWKLSFGKSTSISGGKSSPVEESPPLPHADAVGANGKSMSATASNVTSLLMSLNAPPAPSPAQPRDIGAQAQRGRRIKSPPSPPSMWGPTAVSAAANHLSSPSTASIRPRGTSPASTRSGRPLASSASSMASSNWRSSMSSAGTSTSAFTRYSNGSTRSISTAATSVSSTSWRSGNGSKHENHGQPSALPANVKVVTGTPWELNVLPRQMYRNPDDVQFSAPPVRKPRLAQKSKLNDSSVLGTISERPQHKEPVAQRMDASTSTTELDSLARDRDSNGSHEGTPRKVQKGQINALAKMLSALRR